jgi:rhamnogalacturonyl hydrolase YesR
MMMAKTQLLNLLPGDHPGREEVRLDLERQILGIAKYQNGDGLWHQLLDKNDSYTETSCTAMFVYAVARAVNQKWIDKRYATIALRGWEGLVAQKITAEGQVRDVCVGTGIQENLVFYYQRPTTLQNKHGLGPMLEAGIEVIRLKKMLQ